MRAILSTSFRRTPGPIATGHGIVRKSSNSILSTMGRGVWVPAFAGTTTLGHTFAFSRRNSPEFC
jgi:hypothetical protein